MITMESSSAVEQENHNLSVAGSNPASPTNSHIGAASVAITCEAILAITIFIAAAIGCNVGKITAAVGNWVLQ